MLIEYHGKMEVPNSFVNRFPQNFIPKINYFQHNVCTSYYSLLLLCEAYID